MAVTLKFQSSGMIPGDGRPVQMQGGSLTVGRGPANDLVLPDPDRLLSKNHCVLEDHNGKVVHYAGDAILAEFATVTEALSCAVASLEFSTRCPHRRERCLDHRHPRSRVTNCERQAIPLTVAGLAAIRPDAHYSVRHCSKPAHWQRLLVPAHASATFHRPDCDCLAIPL